MRAKIDLHNMDCMTAIREMEDNKFDLDIVDPPYGIGADKANNSNKGNFGYNQYHETDWDKMKPSAEYWENMFRVSKNQIVWGANYYPEFMCSSMGWIVWDKKQDNFSFSDGELAWSSFSRKLKFFRCSRSYATSSEGGRIHPTQKPIKLYKWILENYAEKGQTILDTHLGSGSIALACWDLGFDLTAYEVDKTYFASAFQRLEEHKKQGQFEFA